MLKYSDFQEASVVQSTIFTPGFSFITHKILIDLLQLRPGMFDGEPVVLPLPHDAPPELPRIILQDKNGTNKIEVSPTRVNFFRIKTVEDDRVDIQRFIIDSAVLLKEYLSISGARCGRLASVLKRFCIKDDPSKEIVSHFCKEVFLNKPFDGPASFELHARKRYQFIEAFEVNSWVRIKSGQVQYPSETPKPIVLIEQDINTLAEILETKNYTEEEILSFFGNVFDEFNDILRIYCLEN